MKKARWKLLLRELGLCEVWYWTQLFQFCQSDETLYQVYANKENNTRNFMEYHLLCTQVMVGLRVPSPRNRRFHGMDLLQNPKKVENKYLKATLYTL